LTDQYKNHNLLQMTSKEFAALIKL